MKATIGPTTGEVNIKALAFVRAVQVLRGINPELQAQAIEILFTIASHPNIPMRELQERLGIASSSISRNIASLGAYGKRKPGLKLVEAYEDAMDRRLKLVRLTSKGKAVVQQVYDALEAGYGTKTE